MQHDLVIRNGTVIDGTGSAGRIADESGNQGARGVLTEGVGQGVGMLRKSKSARTVVQEFMEDFASAMERMNAVTGIDKR